MSEIVMKNIGPIKHFSFPVPEGGGVIVFRGPNGSGKTHALDATALMLGGKDKPPILDDEAAGTVEGLGVRITIGPTLSRRGSLEVESIEGRLDLSSLVDPGIADPDAANARRIKSLVSLSGVTFTDVEVAKKLGVDDGELPPGLPENLVEKVGKLKRHFEKVARQHAEVAEKARATAAGLRLANKDVNLDHPSDAELLQALVVANIRQQAELQAKDNAAIEMREKIDDAVEELENLDDDNLFAARRELAEAQGNLETSRLNLETARAESVAALERFRDADGVCSDANQRFEFATNLATRRENLAELVGQVIEKPTQDELEAAINAHVTAQEAVEHGAIVRKAIDDEAAAVAEDGISRSRQREADLLRERAKATDAILNEAVDSLGTMLCINDGLLSTETDRGLEPFAELSHGERSKLALRICANYLGKGGVLAYRQEAWEGLDAEGRADVCRDAHEFGVVVITAEADHEEMGELRAELFDRGGTDAAAE
ncbi:MAG: AAA family ATPase [Planctomycetota bacterium]|nr:AAA family ATPase [Planctomycetota bacterium]